MWRVVIPGAVLILAATIGGAPLSRAADPTSPPKKTVGQVLAGMAVSNTELGQQHAKGILLTNAVSEGTVSGNSVGPGVISGTITNNSSIDGNVGITTVFQNTGNNTLMQNSTSIFISVH